jgi:ubiquinone/menaquinone biosynthesis C-methylase UbiE
MILNKKLIKYVIYYLLHLDFQLIKIYIRFVKNKLSTLGKPNFASEILSWERKYHNNRKGRKIFKKKPLDNTLKNIIESLKDDFEIIRCLDVGSGPRSVFYSNYFDNKDNFDLVAVDPLAQFYKRLQNKYFQNYEINSIPGFGEILKKIFPKNYFNVIYSRNAIDHSQSPKKFFDNIYDILKKGGFIILIGFINEGTHQNWSGLHKWDISLEKRNLMLSNQNGVINYNITNNYKMKMISKKITETEFNDKKIYKIIFQKYYQK